jgi:hypothetical protein
MLAGRAATEQSVLYSEQAIARHEADEEDGYHAEGARRKLGRLLGAITTLHGDSLVHRLREKALVVSLAADLGQLWRLWRLWRLRRLFGAADRE